MKSKKMRFNITVAVVVLGILALFFNQAIIGIVLIAGGIIAGSYITKQDSKDKKQ